MRSFRDGDLIEQIGGAPDDDPRQFDRSFVVSIEGPVPHTHIRECGVFEVWFETVSICPALGALRP